MSPSQFTIGNIVTIVSVIFMAGGAWVALKAGIADLRKDFREARIETGEHFLDVHKEIADIRNEFVRRDVDTERDRAMTMQMSSLREEQSRQARRLEDLDKRR